MLVIVLWKMILKRGRNVSRLPAKRYFVLGVCTEYVEVSDTKGVCNIHSLLYTMIDTNGTA